MINGSLLCKDLLIAIEFFTVSTKLAEMVILASKDLRTLTNVPPVGLDLMEEIITGLRVQHLTNQTKQTCAI